MIIVRVLTMLAKPAIVSGAIAATATGGWLAYDHFRPNDASPFQQLQGAGQRLLINEFGDTTDTIVAVDPNDIDGARTQIATIDHATGFGAFATLSPDGRAIAFTALPVDTPRPGPDSPAHAAVVDVDDNVTLLADDVDLLVPPVWSPDSASIVVRKNTPEDNGAGAFELLLLGRDGARSTLTTWHTAAVFPIAFSPDGASLYFATLNTGGTDLYRIAPDGSDETQIAHLSDQIARDWKLSPDGRTLVYSVAESGVVPQVATRALDIASGNSGDAIVSDAPRMEFNPAWKRDNTLTVAALRPEGGADASDIDATGATSPVTRNSSGIDLPLGYSPDGAVLAVRDLDGKTPFDGATSHVELIAGGDRHRLSESADVEIVGWLQ